LWCLMTSKVDSGSSPHLVEFQKCCQAEHPSTPQKACHAKNWQPTKCHAINWQPQKSATL
jgi:hypothetical protein